MPSDDLTAHAASDTDFYALLDITTESTPSEIQRAYRKAALKYHPDKNRDDPVAAADKFHLVHIASEVLLDPAAKKAYDDVRASRLHRQRQADLFDGKRRQMKEDLENRERGFKRKREEEESAEEILQKKIRQLAADGERRRREKEEALRKEMEQQEATQRQQEKAEQRRTETVIPRGGTEVPEIQRTVKATISRKALDQPITKEWISEMFSTFGKVESAFLLGSKPDKKQAKAAVTFTSIVAAHAAVEDIKQKTTPEWKAFKSVFWAEGKEPDVLQDLLQWESSRRAGPATKSPTPPENSAPSTPLPSRKTTERPSFPGLGSTPTTPISSFKAGANGLKKVPSFASFSPASFSTPKSSPFAKGDVQSPSLEEVTMIRLKNAAKNAEKRKLEEQIRRQEQEQDRAAEGAGAS